MCAAKEKGLNSATCHGGGSSRGVQKIKASDRRAGWKIETHSPSKILGFWYNLASEQQ